MSHFYGTLQGSRGQATRCGTRVSGVTTVAASWAGAVRCEAYERDGEDHVRVSFIPWQGRGTRRELYDGPIDPGEAEPIPHALNCSNRHGAGECDCGVAAHT